MNSDAQQFLNLTTKPARLTCENVAWLLGFAPYEIPILVAKGFLRPIGDPPHNGVKYFASADIEVLKADRKWLARATSCIHRHWEGKNRRRTGGDSGEASPHETRTGASSKS